MKKKYILNDFPTREEAQKRNHEFALKHGIKEDSGTKYMFTAHCLIKEQWGLEVSEDYLHLLEDKEKTPDRLREIPNQPFIQPYIPMVFRYLEKEFVDLFFNEGIIRLSSFRKFHKHTDEQRGDKKEGQNHIVGIGKEKTMFAETFNGDDAFVLSTSLMLNDQMYDDFNVDACLVIEKPIEFMNSIAQKIPEFKGINFGPCLYQPDKSIRRKMDFDLESLKSDDDPNSMDMNKMFNAVNQISGKEVLFAKTNEYSPQHEYRFLWHSELKNLPEFIYIEVPEAIEFCRKIERK